MQNKHHVLYVSGTVPQQGPGSFIIFYRHLRKLEDSNWKISIAAPEQFLDSKRFPESWQVIPIPMRRWWWLPVRPQITGTLELRLRQWCFECELILRRDRPSVILTNLWDIYSLLAAFLSKKWKIPLSVIVHDDWEIWSSSEYERSLVRKYKRIVLAQADRVWPVSSELGDSLNLKNTEKLSTLLPIPHGGIDNFINWNDKFKSAPTIAYAGKLYPYLEYTLEKVADTLKQINGTLLLIVNPVDFQSSAILKKCSNITCIKPFNENIEVSRFLGANSSCILVSYPLFSVKEEHSWKILSSSFPSKFVEFCHLGLPVILLTPPNTALSGWAEKHQWLSCLTYPEEEKLLRLANNLIQEDTWKQMAEQSKKVALTEFNPSIIQDQFETELTAILQNYKVSRKKV